MRRNALSASAATLTFILVCAGAARSAPPPAGVPATPATPAATAAPQATPAPAAPSAYKGTTLIRLHADHLAFYYDRFLIEADGHVRVTTSNGLQVSGDAFSMDLKLNRFLVAGHVELQIGNERVSGAAISDFMDFDRIYFVPVTTEPDRWTFVNGDLRHPLKGRDMPPDVFYFPQISGPPSLTATGAAIGAKSYVRFSGTTMMVAGVPLVPLGSFVVNFSPNPYFSQNSLTGATADLTWNFAGNDNSLSALHVRYDPTNHAYLSFEQHFIGQHEYAVFSVNPLTALTKWWNLQLFDSLGSRFQVQTFTQLFTTQYPLNEPEATGQTTYLNATYAFPHSYLTLSSNQTNYNLLSPAALFTAYGAHVGWIDHPSQAQLTWTGFQNRVGHLPLYVQTYEGMGFNHDSVGPASGVYVPGIPLSYPPGLQAFGAACTKKTANPLLPFAQACPAYTTIYNQVLGFTAYMPALKFGNLNSQFDQYQFNASFSDQRQWFTVPHHVNTQTTTASVSRQFSKSISTYVAYQVANTSDLYLLGGYPSCVPLPIPLPPPDKRPADACPIIGGVPVNSYAGFRGASTLRTVNVGAMYAPSPEFNFSLLFRKHDDFPQPYPGLFAAPLTNVLGQQIANNYLGQPPYDITPDIRFRILPHLMLDISRTYYFNFGNLKWNPTTIVQMVPQ